MFEISTSSKEAIDVIVEDSKRDSRCKTIRRYIAYEEYKNRLGDVCESSLQYQEACKSIASYLGV